MDSIDKPTQKSRIPTLVAAVIAHLLFWGWNCLIVVGVYAMGVYVLPPLAVATYDGIVPWDLTLMLLGAMAVAPVSIGIVAAISSLRGTFKLMSLFYGFEIPMFMLMTTRVFLVRETTWSQFMVIVLAAFGLLAYLNSIWGAEIQNSWKSAFRIFGLSILAFVSIQVGILVFIYMVPAIVDIWSGFWRSYYYFSIEDLFIVFVVLVTASVYLSLPVFGPYAHISALVKEFKIGRKVLGLRATSGFVAAGLLVWVSTFVASLYQPQNAIFEMLDKPANTDQIRQERLSKAEEIRYGLLNAYLSPWRYYYSTQESVKLSSFYARQFGGTREDYKLVDDIHKLIVLPFVYDGPDTRSDSSKAELAYEAFFDAPLQKIEKESVNQSLNATWNRDSVEAGLLDVDKREVWLEKQEIIVNEQGDLAQIEIHEIYQNDTFEDKEILYYFSLPEMAVVTGLWLGEQADKSKAFKYVVAPRGAAQQVYREQVRRRVDPALLEQIGPRQYRLRAFPIPRRERISGVLHKRPMHLWLQYVVAAEDGKWPLPTLLEKRNIYWTASTARKIVRDNEVINVRTQGNRVFDKLSLFVDTNWLPASIKAQGDTKPRKHQFVYDKGDGNAVVTSFAPSINRRESLPEGLKIALVWDRSYSMKAHEGILTDLIHWLNTEVVRRNRVDVLLTAGPARHEEPRLLKNVQQLELPMFYGGHWLSHMLWQSQYWLQEKYDAIVVITDDGGASLEPEKPVELKSPSPVWLLHVGDKLPTDYSDAVGDLILTSGGHISQDISWVMSSIARSNNTAELFHDRYNIELEKNVPATEIQAQTSKSYFSKLVAHRMVMKGMGDMGGLDELHKIALRYQIATPVSSMIVLVNDQQRKALDKASKAEDRFDRETESGKEAMSSAQGQVVPSAPEPEEWALIFMVAALIVWATRPRWSQALNKYIQL